MEAFKILGRIALEGAEKAKETLGGLGDKAKKTGDSLKNAGKKTKNAGKKVSAFTTGPILAAGAGMVAMANKTGDYADRILDLNAITGMSTDEIQKWQQVAKDAGVNSEFMTNASQQLTKQMTTLKEGTGKSSESLAELGLTYEDLEKASPDERMELMIDRLREIEDPAERARLGTDLFRGSYEDLAPVLGMTAEEIEASKEKAEDMGSVMSGDALNDANDFRVEMEDMQTNLMNLGREFAMEFLPIIRDTFMPIIENVITKVKEVAEWFNGLSDNTKQNIVRVGLLVAAIGPLLVVFGSVMGAIGSIITTVSKLTSVIRVIRTAVLAMNTAWLASPITWIIVGIMAVIAAAILLWKNWDEVKAWLINLWDIVWGKAKEIFGNIKNWITTKVTEIKDGIVNRFTEAKDKFVDKAGEILSNAKRIFNKVKNAIWNPIKNVRDKISGFISDIKSWFGGLNLGIEIPRNISLPHFEVKRWSLNPKNWITNGPPYLDIDWYASGGVFDAPSIIGVGEAGKEAVLPLEGRPMRGLANELAKQIGTAGATGTIEVPVYLDGREIARAISSDMDRELEKERRKNAKFRSVRTT